ncbi:MAG: flippase-like domain-containing protein [Ardenticatenaceae bacterium]|nr:flippase-like domain-containing protein [Ardenticatenaceae bacterium]
MRKYLSNILKIAITVGGLIYVWTQVPLAEVQAELTDIQWSWALLALAMIVASLVVRAYRWYVLLQGLGANVHFQRLVELYFVGNFFNSFLPSGFGGDVVRVLEAAQNVPANIAAGTVIVDRLAGLLMLFVMALIALPFRPASFPADLTWQITAVSLIGLITGFVLLDGRLIRRWGRWLPGKLSVTDPEQPLAKLLQAVQGCGWPAIFKALAVSVLFNFMLCGWWLVSGLSMGHTIPFSHYLLVIPILSVLLLIPSIGGLGVRETVAPILFASAGLTFAESATLSFLIFILMRISGLFGGPVYLLSVLRKRER